VGELDRLRKEWKAGSRSAPYMALMYCRHERKKIPDWALEAIELDGAQAGIEDWKRKSKTRRYHQPNQDRSIHATVLDFRRQGLTWEKAYQKAAETVGTWDGSMLTVDRVKNAYVRVRRLEKRKLV
jgi:hypothetical protein